MPRKPSPHPTKRVVHLTELQSQFVADMRERHGLPDDDAAIREIIGALMEILKEELGGK